MNSNIKAQGIHRSLLLTGGKFPLLSRESLSPSAWLLQLLSLVYTTHSFLIGAWIRLIRHEPTPIYVHSILLCVDVETNRPPFQEISPTSPEWKRDLLFYRWASFTWQRSYAIVRWMQKAYEIEIAFYIFKAMFPANVEFRCGDGRRSQTYLVWS